MVVKAADGTVIQTIESKDFTNHTAANNYWVTITKILPKDMAKVYNLEMYIGDTLVSSTATYSVESYVRLLHWLLCVTVLPQLCWANSKIKLIPKL